MALQAFSAFSKTLLLTLFLVNCAEATPGYGSYNYDGHGHQGFNAVGNYHKVDDYYSKPQYAFGYEVEDYYTQLSHGRWEVRDGDVTQGQYRVLLPDGRLQIVSYIADKGGYRPTIQYIQKGVHPPPPPAYVHIKPPKGLPDPFIQNPVVFEPTVPIAIDPQFAPAFGGSGPPKLDVTPHGDPLLAGPFPGRRFKGRFGNGFGHGDPLYYVQSTKSEVKLSPDKIFRRRAQLYDRTLFRRDIPQPPTKPR